MIRTYVLDTNVLLHDPKSLFVFEEHDIIIPIWVIEEIDKFKGEQSTLGYNARTTGRYLDKMRERGSLKVGVPLNGGGTLRVDWDENTGLLFSAPKSIDNAILQCAQRWSTDTNREVILVTRDSNMRVKADALGIRAENYRHDQAAEPDKQYTGFREIECMDEEIDAFYAARTLLPGVLPDNLNVHEFLVLKGYDGKSAVARWDGTKLCRIPKHETWKIRPRNKEQLFALDLLLNPDIKLVTLSGLAGSGKAQPLDAKVLTPHGWCRMGDIRCGDDVMTPAGTSSKVIGVFPQGEKDIYTVHFTDGTSTECCEDHLWETKTDRDRWRKQSGSVKSLKEIAQTLRSGKQNKRNHLIPITAPLQFETANQPMDPYLLGCLIGDGGMTHGLQLTSKDAFLLDKCGEILKKMGCALVHNSKYDYFITRIVQGATNVGRIFSRVNPADGITKQYDSLQQVLADGYTSNVYKACKSHSMYGGYLWSSHESEVKSVNPVIDALMILGLWGNRSECKFVPDQYKFASLEQRLALFQGLMDTDGTIGNKTGGVSFTTVSHQLMLDVTFLVQSFGGTCTMRSRIPKYKYKGVQKNGQRAHTLDICLPNGIAPFALPRKQQRVKVRTKYHPRRYVDRVEYAGAKPAQCILIDSTEHLYLTNDCIVTHNTLLAIAAGLSQTCDAPNLYRKVLVSRPVIPMGKDIGFLPGTMAEKLAPWMQPIFDNLEVLIPNSVQKPSARNPDPEPGYKHLLDRELLQVEALTYIRGRSIPEQFMLIDESQNLSPHELKTILTRAGEGTKIVLTGDPAQIDNPYVDARTNGLTYAIERFKDSKIAGHVTLQKGERSELAEESAKRL